MNTTKEYNKLNINAYARDNSILNIPKWKWEIILTNNPKKFIRMFKIFDDHTKRNPRR